MRWLIREFDESKNDVIIPKITERTYPITPYVSIINPSPRIIFEQRMKEKQPIYESHPKRPDDGARTGVKVSPPSRPPQMSSLSMKSLNAFTKSLK
jgi:hypothetical protein